MDGGSVPSSIQVQDVSSTTVHDLRPMLIVYEGGRVERLLGKDTVPASPSDDVISSKDVQISQFPPVSARLYHPKNTSSYTKGPLPLLIYFHGGAFAIESAFSPTYHHYLHRLAAESSAIIVSVNYRLAPEHPLPAAYDDCWAAVEWAVSGGGDSWVSEHADLSRIFFAGDSAGANIAHHMGIRFGKTRPRDGVVGLAGLVLVHPFFLGEEPIYGDNGPTRMAEREFGRRVWAVVSGDPHKSLDHPWINPRSDGEVGKIGCGRVLVFVAEKDALRNRGVYYAEEVLGKTSGWAGKVEVVETKGEGHVFHLFNSSSENAVKLMEKIVDFINS